MPPCASTRGTPTRCRLPCSPCGAIRPCGRASPRPGARAARPSRWRRTAEQTLAVYEQVFAARPNRMRIVHLPNLYAPSVGGSPEPRQVLSEAFAAGGDDVTVFTSNAIDASGFYVDDPTLRVEIRREVRNGVSIRRFPIAAPSSRAALRVTCLRSRRSDRARTGVARSARMVPSAPQAALLSRAGRRADRVPAGSRRRVQLRVVLHDLVLVGERSRWDPLRGVSNAPYDREVGIRSLGRAGASGCGRCGGGDSVRARSSGGPWCRSAGDRGRAAWGRPVGRPGARPTGGEACAGSRQRASRRMRWEKGRGQGH